MKYTFITPLLIAILAFTNFAFASNQANNPQPSGFGNWQLICDKKPCFINQSLIASNGKMSGIVGSLNVTRIQNDRTMLTIKLSKNALQSAGIGIKVDNNKDTRVKILGCDAKVCQTNVLVDDQLQSEFENGRALRIVYFDNNTKKQVTLPFTLNGYSEAFKAMN